VPDGDRRRVRHGVGPVDDEPTLRFLRT